MQTLGAEVLRGGTKAQLRLALVTRNIDLVRHKLSRVHFTAQFIVLGHQLLVFIAQLVNSLAQVVLYSLRLLLELLDALVQRIELIS